VSVARVDDDAVRPTTVHRWLTIDETAQLLSVNHKTVRRRIAEGEIAATRVGPKLLRVRLSDVEAFMARTVASSPPSVSDANSRVSDDVGTDLYAEEDAEDEPTVWQRTDDPERPLAVLTRSDLRAAVWVHDAETSDRLADQLWSALTTALPTGGQQ
jgi:excisionase family DNA binding protein